MNARCAAAIGLLLLSGCEMLGVYRHETAGISPVELLPLYGQEKQYVTDRDLEAKVRAALAAQGMRGVEVEVYLKDVSLRGGDPGALEIARAVHGVKSVRFK
jgi:osmotically-inducible protein OsmY